MLGVGVVVRAGEVSRVLAFLEGVEILTDVTGAMGVGGGDGG